MNIGRRVFVQSYGAFILLNRCKLASNSISINVYLTLINYPLCLPTVIDYDDSNNGGFGANEAPILSSKLPDS